MSVQSVLPNRVRHSGLAQAAVSPLNGPAATILADSISPEGVRLITFEMVMHRFVLSENNTHKVVGKCAASSRAIPVHKQIKMLLDSPAFPVKWASEQRGMQGGDALSDEQIALITHRWRRLLEHTIREADEIRGLGLHKSLTNRLLEPWMWIRVVQTATAWDNFFYLRDHKDAQPEIAAVARLANEARADSTPVLLGEGQWHLPYVSGRDREEVQRRAAQQRADDPVAVLAHQVGVERALAAVSAARCARTSYLTNPVVDEFGQVVEEAKIDLVKDLALVDDLIASQPRHWSPFEHQATPWAANRQSEPVPFTIDGRDYLTATGHLPRVGNLLGWRHQRTERETILNEITFR